MTRFINLCLVSLALLRGIIASYPYILTYSLELITRFVADVFAVDFSEFLFVGDSLTQYWLCYSPDDSPGKLTTAPCIIEMDEWTHNPDNIPVLCSGQNSHYCSSSFSKAFPHALNMGMHGKRVDDWIERLQLKDDMITKIITSGKYKQIVVELGANDIMAGAGESYLEQIVQNFKQLMNMLHANFPNSQIHLLSTLPRPNMEVTYSIDVLNSHLKANFYKSVKFPFVQYHDISTAFYDGENVSIDFYQRGTVHLNSVGYGVLEEAIKSSVAGCGDKRRTLRTT